ncbi:patatin-like phospholipase family protein [Pararhizobium sp. BT-229]|uniref:patatin-like phospholipase family protein n=1 Tax=Pararhizobium sp. BT-229 TaxID=2986923 RepID=UPI0021F6AB04|nr:patatin-like phospholipase family protein [Pararhizobium sp. BT-229]MCV9960337.1 patatin-like phospholipase family protein [Pararhizobium sp. BT-229]
MSKQLNSRGNIWGIRSVVDRIPIIIVGAVYIFIATRENDQISSILQYITTGSSIIASCITVAMSAALLAFVQRGNAIWRVIDTLLFSFPAIIYVYALRSSHGLISAVACLGLLASLALAFRIWKAAPNWKTIAVIGVSTVIIWLCLAAAIRTSPTVFPQALGSVSLSFAFIAFLAIFIQFCIRYLAAGVPLVLVLGSLFLFQERPHRIEQVELPGDETDGAEFFPERQTVSLQQSFEVWLNSRNDLQAYQSSGKAYPVFVVTSEGGGGYAAAHADLFLSKLQKRCPNFAQHIFSLVGVSGGAVGNTMFWKGLPEEVNLSQPKGCTEQNQDKETISRVSSDNLSPVLAALFFKDFPNKFLSIFGARDRADALAASLSQSMGPSYSEAVLLYWNHYWTKERDGGWRMGEKPAVIDVATNVISGKRYVFAPFSFSFPKSRFEESLFDLNWQKDDGAGYAVSDIQFMDAAIASASFPYVTPSRLIDGRASEAIALVDGGYIDNSGAETARDILAELQDPNPDFDGATISGLKPPLSFQEAAVQTDCAQGPQYVKIDPGVPSTEADETCGVKFIVNVISIRAEAPPTRGVDKQNFFFDPITSILAARSRRGETARYALLSQLCGKYNCAPQVELASDWGFYESVIRPDELTLPLGWHLPRERVEELARVVAPQTAVSNEMNDGVDAGWNPAENYQMDVFSNAARNGEMMRQLEYVLKVPESAPQ